MIDKTPGRAWLLTSVSTAGAAASLRVHAWRKLRGLGALYLQQSVCLLPVTARTERDVARLVDKVRRGGGQARCLHVEITDAAEAKDIVAQMQAAADEEYADFLDRLPAFFTELEIETARGRATFAEVEESEADLARYRTWAAKIEARDYFAAPLGARVRAELIRAGEALAAFETLAVSREAPGPGADGFAISDLDDDKHHGGGPGTLRAVPGDPPARGSTGVDGRRSRSPRRSTPLS